MTEKEVKFTIKVDDQATAKLQEIKNQMNSLQGSTQSISANVGNAPEIPKTTVPTEIPKTVVPTEVRSKEPMQERVAEIERANGQVIAKPIEPATDATKSVSSTGTTTPVAKKPIQSSEKVVSEGVASQPAPKKKKTVVPAKDQMIPEEWGRPLRAVGAYRSAWFAGQDTSKGPMKAAAGLFILQAVADGIEKIVKILSESSPLLRAELKVLKIAIGEFLRPIGDLLGTVLRPISRAMLQANAYARSSMAKEGIDQTDLSQYYARFAAGMGALAGGQEILGANAVDLSDTVDALNTLFTVLGYATLPGLVIGLTQFITWLDENKDTLPMFLDSASSVTNNLITLEPVMANLTDTVISLNDAMTDLKPVIELLSDAGNIVESATDTKKFTQLFDGIGNTFSKAMGYWG